MACPKAAAAPDPPVTWLFAKVTLRITLDAALFSCHTAAPWPWDWFPLKVLFRKSRRLLTT